MIPDDPVNEIYSPEASDSRPAWIGLAIACLVNGIYICLAIVFARTLWIILR